MKQTINERIKAVRLEEGLNPTEFAVKAGLSTPAIYKIESGESEPSQKTLRAISKSFGIDLLWLTKGEGAMPKPLGMNVPLESNPWKDALVTELKEEVSYLRDLLKMAVGNKSGNFLKALDGAKIPLYMLKYKGVYSGANSVI